MIQFEGPAVGLSTPRTGEEKSSRHWSPNRPPKTVLCLQKLIELVLGDRISSVWPL